MRKNNDGYVLPFVLVVMIVLCIISTSLMTAALRNLQMQQRFTERMVDKYAAQGEIEKAVAQLQQEIVIEGESEELTAEEVAEALKSTNDCILEVIPVDKTAGEDETAEKEKSFDFTLSLRSSSEATTIDCVVALSAEYTSEQVVETSQYKYTIKVTNLTYQSYEISTGGGT